MHVVYDSCNSECNSHTRNVGVSTVEYYTERHTHVRYDRQYASFVTTLEYILFTYSCGWIQSSAPLLYFWFVMAYCESLVDETDIKHFRLINLMRANIWQWH